MMIRLYIVSGFLLLSGCIEKYDFFIENNDPELVVEGFISDVSYSQTLEYPSDGRFFSVKLSYTNDVSSYRGEDVTGASVILKSDNGDEWSYTETEPGEYLLTDDNFKARPGVNYKIEIGLSNDEIYESTWQQLPSDSSETIGQISFRETNKYTYKIIAGEEQVVDVDGINVLIDLPENQTGKAKYYRWDFTPTWVFEASIFPVVNKKCWVTNEYYLSDYALLEDYTGGKTELFFEEMTGNERFKWQFSLLVRQFLMNEGQYQFYRDIKKQSEDTYQGTPPYNLKSNINAVNSSKSAVGYFGVAQESATRWYFNMHDLSYGYIRDPYETVCKNPLDEGGEFCHNCLAYPNGIASLKKPSWWED